MKNLHKKIFTILFVSMTFLVLNSTFVQAQSKEQSVIRSMRSKGFSLVENKYAELSEGESARMWRTFYSGTEYRIYAFSEYENVLDVDLYLYYSDGDLYTSDTDVGYDGDWAYISVKRSFTSDLKLVVKNYDSVYSSFDYHIKILVFYR